MVDVDLEPGAVDTCPEPDPIFAGAMAEQGGSFAFLLVLNMLHRKTSSAPGPLDSVDLQTYTDLWRSVGARVGRVVNGAVAWE